MCAVSECPLLIQFLKKSIFLRSHILKLTSYVSCQDLLKQIFTLSLTNNYIFIVKSCADLYEMGNMKDGIYSIDPDGRGSFNVNCDMTTDGGGWTVFQRRQDGSVDFYRNWTDYKNGFGNMSGEFWLGLENIKRLTKDNDKELRVDLEDFEGEKRYAKYEMFKVKPSEKDKYKLIVEGYTGECNQSMAERIIMA